MGQFYRDDDDKMNPGKKVGIGVYFQKNPKITQEYVGTININGNNYLVALMCKVKPNAIRCPCSSNDFWILNGLFDEVRPYRILLKQCNSENNYLYKNMKEFAIKEKSKNKKNIFMS